MPFDPNATASSRIVSANNKSGYETMYNVTGGFTKRELMIIEMLAPLLVNGKTKKVQQGLIQVDVQLTPAELADMAIAQADALIAKL